MYVYSTLCYYDIYWFSVWGDVPTYNKDSRKKCDECFRCYVIVITELHTSASARRCHKIARSQEFTSYSEFRSSVLGLVDSIPVSKAVFSSINNFYTNILILFWKVMVCYFIEKIVRIFQIRTRCHLAPK